MTETEERDTIAEALEIIDRGLGEMFHRELVSSAEVADLLLDVRTVLTADPVDVEDIPEPSLSAN